MIIFRTVLECDVREHPGRVTLTTEGGLVRRIYTDGRSLPQDIEDSHTGTSVGHWEGTTLVVETAGIDPKNKFAPLAGAPAIGKNVRITERISLKDEDTLEFDITVVAPDIFTRPDRRKRIYTRTPKQTAREISFCVDYDRSIDPSTGQQRFDRHHPQICRLRRRADRSRSVDRYGRPDAEGLRHVVCVLRER